VLIHLKQGAAASKRPPVSKAPAASSNNTAADEQDDDAPSRDQRAMKRARAGVSVQEGGGKEKSASLLMLTEEEQEDEEGEGEDSDWVPSEEGSVSKKRAARSGCTNTPRGKQQAQSTRRDRGGGGASVSQGGAGGGGALDGLVICCSGTLTKIRSAFQEMIREHGGGVANSVGGSTTHLVTTATEAENPTRKVLDAMAKRVAIGVKPLFI
jgi:NAD-dependent DNA ligase